MVTAALRAYYDASGTQVDKGGILAFLGLVTSEAKWLALEEDWERILDRFRVPYLHMREYAHSLGPYAKWKGKEKRRRLFIRCLVDVMGTYVDFAPCVGVDMEAYRRIDEEYLISEKFGEGHREAGAYVVAGRHCLADAYRWAADERPGCEIGHILEADDAGQGALRKSLADKFESGAIGILPKVSKSTGRRVRPFEVADLAAYEWKRWFQRSFTESPPGTMAGGDPRGSWLALKDRVRFNPFMLEHANIMGLVQDHGIKERTS